jgi:exosome complex RNA-binding protein Csl4
MENMKCESCGGPMKKLDDSTMKCESCGATKEIKKEDGATEEAK